MVPPYAAEAPAAMPTTSTTTPMTIPAIAPPLSPPLLLLLFEGDGEGAEIGGIDPVGGGGVVGTGLGGGVVVAVPPIDAPQNLLF